MGSRADQNQVEWNQVVRGETEIQAHDRQFGELLQELRVAQTGVQILFAFLLGLAFTPRFADLSGGQQGVYLVTLVLAAVSAALLWFVIPLVHRIRRRPVGGDSA
jgi:hypothetical protein